MVISTSTAFWLTRLSQAVDSARNAPSNRSRIAYLELAHHYWSMHELVNGPIADAKARLAFDRLMAAELNIGPQRPLLLQAA
jgi:hypothetical protein